MIIIFIISFSVIAQEQNNSISGSKAKQMYDEMKVPEKSNYLIDEVITSKENSKMKCYYISNRVYNVDSYICTKK